MMFPTSDNPEQTRYLEISPNRNSKINLVKWFVTDNYTKNFIFSAGLIEKTNVKTSALMDIPEEAVGFIYTISPVHPINIDFEFDTKPNYYERRKSGDTGHGHYFGICGMLYIPSKNGFKAKKMTISGDIGRINVKSWLIPVA